MQYGVFGQEEAVHVTEMPFGDLLLRTVVEGAPLTVLWWLIVKRLQKPAPSSILSPFALRLLPVIAGAAIGASVFTYMYAVFPIWAFSLGSLVGLVFGEKRFGPIVLWGIVALLAFELCCGPKLREFGRHRPLAQPLAPDSQAEPSR